MDPVKMPIWCVKATEWCDGMMLDLGELTMKTMLGPTVHVSIDAWPDVVRGDESLGCLNI